MVCFVSAVCNFDLIMGGLFCCNEEISLHVQKSSSSDSQTSIHQIHLGSFLNADCRAHSLTFCLYVGPRNLHFQQVRVVQLFWNNTLRITDLEMRCQHCGNNSVASFTQCPWGIDFAFKIQIVQRTKIIGTKCIPFPSIAFFLHEFLI